MTPRRVVVTGLGAICGIGNDLATIWDSLKNGRSGIGEITTTPLGDLVVRTGCEIKALPETGLVHRQLVTMDRFSLLAVIAARQAIEQSGLVIDAENGRRVGAVIGTGVCGWEAIEESYRSVFLENKKRVNVFTVPRVMPGAAAGQVSMNCGIRGPVFGVTSACASSNHAFASALDLLRSGRTDAIVVGGTDAPIIYGILKAWEALRVLSRDTCRPFSADREGLVLGEGAGCAVLETLEHAQARGAPILAEIAGAGMSADAADIVAPTLEGPIAAIQACLADARLAPDDVDYINAHGTGTKANDRIEASAIKTVFGVHTPNVSVSSTKSMHGHCLGASGALEMIACVMAIREGVVPPTVGYREPDPDCDLDVTPNVARERTVRVALSNAFAFGGTNAVVAVKAFDG